MVVVSGVAGKNFGVNLFLNFMWWSTFWFLPFRVLSGYVLYSNVIYIFYGFWYTSEKFNGRLVKL